MKTTGPIEASFAQPLSVGGEFGGAALATAVAAPDPGDEVRPAADAREAEKEQEGRWPPQARRAVAELPSRIIAPTTLDVIAPAPAKGDDPFPSDWLERTLQGIDQRQTATRADIAPLEQPVPAATEPEPQVSAEAKAAVVGEYKAGGVAYLMYADGSIEADTPNGVYRFMSINELKSFIESQGSAGPA